MLFSSIPVKFSTPFASAAGPGYITTPIPVAPGAPGRASLEQGFPINTFEPEASGGNPPFGADANGILNMATAWLQWATAGGLPVTYDATFSAAVGGYPKWALLLSNVGNHYWISQVDNNTTDPDSVGASNWQKFPDVLIQQQAGNVATDTGAANAIVIALSPVPASWASIIGSPLRFFANHATTTTNPTLTITGVSGAKTLINSDGTALAVGQISRAGQFCEGFYDGTNIQLTSPPKTIAGAKGVPVGAIFWFPVETPPVGFLECNGSVKNIVDYPNLFDVIGNKYGGDGVTTFAVPGIRGKFIRGWDHGAGVDPNASTRTNRGDGVTGDHVGTNQATLTGTITGSFSIANPIAYEGASFTGGFPVQTTPGAFLDTQPPIGGVATGIIFGTDLGWTRNGLWFGYNGVDHSIIVQGLTGTVTVSGGAESRPINIYMMPVIAY